MGDLQVLHVDDEPDMRLLVKLSLAMDSSISTRSASSGTEALDAMTYWRPDVILLDAVMPEMDGLATLKALQANPRTAGIPVLFLTGKCADSDIDAFKSGGSAGVIAKPFNPQALASAIRGYVGEAPLGASEDPAPTGAMPDFVGRTVGGAGHGLGSGAGFPLGTAMASAPLGVTTSALLLDSQGKGFALTITDETANRSDASSLLGSHQLVHTAPAGATAGTTPSYTLHVTPLDAATVTTILGADALIFHQGNDGSTAAAPDPFAAATPAIPPVRAFAGAAEASTLTPGDHAAGPVVGALDHASDWSALLFPHGTLH